MAKWSLSNSWPQAEWDDLYLYLEGNEYIKNGNIIVGYNWFVIA